MFQKLRNRFLLVNLISISLIMLVAFATIYTITYQDVQSDIAAELDRVSDFYLIPDMGLGEPHFGGGRRDLGLRGNPNPPPERSVSFLLLTDAQWNLIAVNSRFDMDDDFFGEAVKQAAAIQAEQGQFVLDGNRWLFQERTTKAGYSVVYLDVTARHTILTNLVYTFSIVGSVMLIVIFFLSRYFANRSITPVPAAFE